MPVVGQRVVNLTVKPIVDVGDEQWIIVDAGVFTLIDTVGIIIIETSECGAGRKRVRGDTRCPRSRRGVEFDCPTSR